ncbi:hypothetical protein H4R27_004096, partial [Coemansia aciculifera]
MPKVNNKVRSGKIEKKKQQQPLPKAVAVPKSEIDDIFATKKQPSAATTVAPK